MTSQFIPEVRSQPPAGASPTTALSVSSVLALPLLSVVLHGQPVCSVAACFGSPGVDPLTISGAWVVNPSSLLDFGQRHVIFAPGAALVLSGNATLLAARLTMEGGSTITGSGGILTVAATVGGGHGGSISIAGVIDLSSPAGGGSVQASAGGSFTIWGPGAVRSTGIGFGATGGSLSVQAVGPVLLDGAMVTLDASGFLGGSINMSSSARSVTILKAISALASPCCSISAGSVQVTATGAVVAGGTIDLTAPDYASAGTVLLSGTPLSITGPINAWAGDFGFGGQVTLSSQSDISAASPIRLSGGSAGGTFSAFAGGNYLQSGQVATASAAKGGTGGAITIQAGGQSTISGSWEAWGGGFSGRRVRDRTRSPRS